MHNFMTRLTTAVRQQSHSLCVLFLAILGCFSTPTIAADETSPPASKPLSVSGIYPHLATFNGMGECGIGGVVPWADKLWMITYCPHEPNGSPDKLYAIAPDFSVQIRPESVGGTPAGRMIHRESKQLFIGPYAIDAAGKVRAISPKIMPGRLTAVARHLSDPANLVYYYDMEGMLYEVNVTTLAVNKLFDKPVPGWHGKGAYTSQGRLVIANNGELPAAGHSYKTVLVGGAAKTPEEMGVLAQWDGQNWEIVERKQFTDVTGPGGIHGAPDDKSPLWSIGWDRRSVILKLLDEGKWSTFRLPKGALTYDHRGGWYTEWPRIREIGPGPLLMDMHSTFFDFPRTFSASNTGGISPVATHLRYIPDFCEWNGKLVLGADDASILQNPMLGQSQSNLWFGQRDALKSFGPRSGWGGPWINDHVKPGESSIPFLINGYEQKVLHLANRGAEKVQFTLEIDAKGDGNWTRYQQIDVPSKGYEFHIFPAPFAANWIRLSVDKETDATAVFHYNSSGHDAAEDKKLFASVADVTETGKVCTGLLRPAKSDRNLQFVTTQDDKEAYFEIDEKLAFSKPESLADEVKKTNALKIEFSVDEASVIMTDEKDKSKRYRLPQSHELYEKGFPAGSQRCIRECVSERFLVNAHGTFYLVGRESGLPAIQPVATHHKQIYDFCTYRGLMVLSGTRSDAQPDGHYFGNAQTGLWFGMIDDLWKLGKPVGEGGPWKNTSVLPHVPSDPYLMHGYDKKVILLQHIASHDVTFTIEVDVDLTGWYRYQTINVPPGKIVAHDFPAGFSAHWLRVISDSGCEATAWCEYK